MAIGEIKCPGCAGILKTPHEFSRVVTCPYCGLISKIHTGALDPTGSFARLTPSRSKISIGFQFTHLNELFAVLGRIRYQYDEGYWDEWWVSSTSKSAWLEEDEGTLLLYTPQKLTAAVPAITEISVGSSISINGEDFFVTEKNAAQVAGSEGEMSESFIPGTEVRILDGAYKNGAASIEYWAEEIALSVATEVTTIR